jgi:hypothetical protein
MSPFLDRNLHIFASEDFQRDAIYRPDFLERRVQPRVQKDDGRVIGLFNKASLGLRAFGGISVGVFGSLIGIHRSLALSALAALVAGGLLAVQ